VRSPLICRLHPPSHDNLALRPSYLLATCTFTPLYGRLCNVLGRKGASQVALLFASLGVLASGLSTSMEMLIASRFVRNFPICDYTLTAVRIALGYRRWWSLCHHLVSQAWVITKKKR